jgi:hypothetical protein
MEWNSAVTKNDEILYGDGTATPLRASQLVKAPGRAPETIVPTITDTALYLGCLLEMADDVVDTSAIAEQPATTGRHAA